jgi:hypothetical protein
VPTEVFVKKHYEETYSFWKRYRLEVSGRLTYRTFRHYVTNDLMPKPTIIKKKSYYLDTSEMHKRLYLISAMINSKRWSFSCVKESVKEIQGDLDIYFKFMQLPALKSFKTKDVISAIGIDRKKASEFLILLVASAQKQTTILSLKSYADSLTKNICERELENSKAMYVRMKERIEVAIQKNNEILSRLKKRSG